MTTPCRFCVASVGQEIADEWCDHDDANESFVSLATALGRLFQKQEPTDEQIGWVANDAWSICEDFETMPPEWRVTRAPEAKSDQYDSIVCRIKVNLITYVFQDSPEPDPPVRLSTFRQWQREAG